MTPAAAPGPAPIADRRDLAAALLLAAVFVASRLAADAAGLHPDPTVLQGLWQLLPPEALSADLPGALLRLHAQPPLWNLVVGLFLQGCGGALDCASQALMTAHRGLTALAVAALWLGLRRAGCGRGIAWGAAAMLALSPSALFYETFQLYSHFVMALCTGLAALLAGMAARGARPEVQADAQADAPGARARGGARAWRLAALFALGAALAWTWALFHPLFIALLWGAAALADRRAALSRAGVVLALGALLLASAPALKSWARLGHPSASSWTGLNLAQTAPLGPEAERHCRFETFRDEMTAEGRGAAPLHAPEVIARSRECLGLALAAIAADPGAWLDGRARMLVRSHRLRPYEYAFYAPIGWTGLPIPDAAHRPQAQVAPGGVVGWAGWAGWAGFAVYVLIAGGALRVVLHAPSPARRRAALGWALLVLWVTAVSHLGNGAEQNRMRWAVEPIWLMLGALALDAALRRPPAAAEPRPSPEPDL